MSKIDDFKAFIKTNPHLIKAVRDDRVSWQKLYEIWDISGPSSNILEEYNNDKKNSDSDFNFNDITKMLKNVNLKSVQNGINNIQKAITFFQQIGSKDKVITTDNYVPRPVYKHFED